jgi:hypothetical protein
MYLSKVAIVLSRAISVYLERSRLSNTGESNDDHLVPTDKERGSYESQLPEGLRSFYLLMRKMDILS